MEYWVISTGDYALWYSPTDSYNYWVLGASDQVGTLTAYMFAGSEVAKECPIHDAFSTWLYSDGTNWVATNDVSIECTGKIRKMLEVFV